MKAWQATPPFGFDALRLIDLPRPTPGPRQVLIKVQAAALNYRDLEMATGTYQGQPQQAFTLLSDGAGQVVEVGAAVTRFSPGERVIGCFWQGWEAGRLSDSAALPLGGPLDGMLSEYVLLDERGVVPCPAHLSMEEAATLPCAALTAWQALVVEGQLKAGDWVLLQGTGGVSLFAFQFALLHGARVIVSSSQDDRLKRLAKLGATGLINYRSTAIWHEQVMAITDGYGVDHVLEVGGPRSFTQSLQSLHPSGQVNVIGYLGGHQGEINPLLILQRNARVRGISVGPRQSFESMNHAIEASGLRPMIDSMHDWLKLPGALAHLQSGRHFGKVVLRITAD
ncbi:zinc-dependent alcohol dehydrogenase family protein [Pseudomonas benzenivorans]|uniref:NAD(P)-dependent alcohol dehydrogenase n=1 Tax=Pseudomonas benzenivorans TaxID=556533 RepID=A0ABY5HC42_9PSED|nr:NAD(P)-dependent alcohol dehydrogenase [Pseudomonas benzenivorans]UTW08912.1 NAD(P)-dependent alcohol dehydrogenase [Pseudomonas benzenivorans]